MNSLCDRRESIKRVYHIFKSSQSNTPGHWWKTYFYSLFQLNTFVSFITVPVSSAQDEHALTMPVVFHSSLKRFDWSSGTGMLDRPLLPLKKCTVSVSGMPVPGVWPFMPHTSVCKLRPRSHSLPICVKTDGAQLRWTDEQVRGCLVV